MTRSDTSTVTFRASASRRARKPRTSGEQTTSKGRTSDARNKVDIKLADKLLEDMAKLHCHVRIEDLKGEDESSFVILKDMLNAAKSTVLYTSLVELIKKHFTGHDTQIGTVGGYFYGCLSVEPQSDIPRVCTPDCFDAVRPPGMETAACGVNVGNYEGGKVEITQRSHSSDSILVYASGKDKFSSFSKTESEKLKSKGIRTASIFDRDSNSLICDKTSIEDLTDISCDEEVSDTCESGWTAIIVFAVIFIILLVCAVVFAYYTWKNNYSLQDTTPTNDPRIFYGGPSMIN